MIDPIDFHRHVGTDAPRIDAKDLLNLDTNVQSYLDTLQYETVSVIPVSAPTGITDQIKIYVSGATFRLYIYDFTNSTWRYANLI